MTRGDIGYWILVFQWALGIWALGIFFVIRLSLLIPHSEFGIPHLPFILSLLVY